MNGLQRPKRVTIGFANFDVVVDPARCEDVDTDGTMHGSQQTIVLRSDSHNEHAKSVLLHEVIHACLYAAGVNVSDRAEEQIVLPLGRQLLGVLRDNPDLVEYLLHREGA